MIKIIDSTYELMEEIGSGGGGRVYLANHKRLNKKVILKADKRKLSTREDLLRREVDILKNLSNSYIPQVYDFFVEDGVVYTVMEYIDGESLDKPLKRGERIPQAIVIKWAIQLLSALEYLHDPVHGSPPRGYVHGDIKPANLMLRPNGDISLIDFNIALALGEEHAVGGSAGYASPEHYGLDFSSLESLSSDSDMTETEELDKTSTETEEDSCVHKKVMPDVRSDIYSVGATLYHLLSGTRPAKNALDVVPLSAKNFSQELVKIIMKALNPNPDLRYQSAAEMLYALKHIRECDTRYKHLKRQILISRIVLIFLVAVGSVSGFIGLRRLQIRSDWLNLTNTAEEQFEQGDSRKALSTIMKVYPDNKNIISPESLPESQEVLTRILGVYDQKDQFETFTTFQLPAAPLSIEISPDGMTAVCTYDENLAIVKLESAEIIATLPMQKSAMSDAKYLNEDIVIYAGINGIAAYGISEDKELWSGEPATTISISADGSTVAAVYKDTGYAMVYEAETGRELYKADFRGRKQKMDVNDVFINPHDNLFALNNDGSMLAVSFSDGSLSVLNLDLDSGNEDIEIYADITGYQHYEGGFYQNYLAVAAANADMEDSVFMIIDINTVTETGGFHSEGFYTTSVNEDGIVVGVDNVLVKINPQTGEQTSLIDTTSYVNAFGYDSQFTAISDAGKTLVFDNQTNQVGEIDREVRSNFLKVGNNQLLIGSSDSPIVWIAKYKEHYETQLANYDVTCVHDEARLSADQKTIIYFSYNSITVCDLEGNVIKNITVPDAKEVYDQQFRREGSKSYLEVVYYDGTIQKYDAATGEMYEESKGDKPDQDLGEVFETSSLRIESPLHGTPKVYEKGNGEMVCELEEDAYLTYVTEIDDYVVAQYVTTDNQYYGYLMNQQCERLAYLPGLSDVLPDGFLFDYHSGYVRKTFLYEPEALLDIAKEKLEEE